MTNLRLITNAICPKSAQFCELFATHFSTLDGRLNLRAFQLVSIGFDVFNEVSWKRQLWNPRAPDSRGRRPPVGDVFGETRRAYGKAIPPGRSQQVGAKSLSRGVELPSETYRRRENERESRAQNATQVRFRRPLHTARGGRGVPTKSILSRFRAYIVSKLLSSSCTSKRRR